MRKVIFLFILIMFFTISAEETGRYQEKDVSGEIIVIDMKTDIQWTKTFVSEKTWEQAIDYCENLTYAGNSDWKLPEIYQMRTLINREKYSPASDFPGIASDRFWSSSVYVNITDFAWYVDFGSGFVGSNGKTESYSVMCVR